VIAPLLGLLAVASYCVGLRGWRLLRAEPEIAKEFVELRPVRTTRTSAVSGFYDRLGAWSGPLLHQVAGPSWRARVARNLDIAGRPDGLDVRGFAARQGAFATLGIIAFLVLLLRGSLVLGSFVAALLVVYPEVWLFSESQRRQRAIERELPDFLDVLAVTVSAGLGFRQALDRIGSTLRGPLAGEVRFTMNRMSVGVSRRAAFTELRERNPRSDTMSLFVTAILQAEELGAPLAETLTALAGDMRREYAQAARRRAARAVPQVSLIVTTVIVPAVVGLIVVALFLGSRTSLR
jgi:tight adherence protein C